jgi:hypothetical protein
MIGSLLLALGLIVVCIPVGTALACYLMIRVFDGFCGLFSRPPADVPEEGTNE